ITGSQTSENVSDTLTVTVKDDSAISSYSVKGVFFTNCVSDINDAESVDGIIVDVQSPESGCCLVIKALDKYGVTVASETAVLDLAEQGVQEIKTDMLLKNAVMIKAYIVNSDNEIVTDIYKTDKGEYKNVPLVSDWITGAKSGLGMGAGIMTPQGAPYGVDPELVDVSGLNVSYTYDNNYPLPATDNALWYKTGAYATGNSSGNNSIYARDGADWEQKALPIGNGYMGGMLFGLPDKDQIQINEETFWAAGYRGTQTSVNPGTVNKNMSEGINGYMSVGNIFVDFHMPQGTVVNNYYRDLNLDEGVAHVQYEYDGVKYSREYFASYPKEVLAFRYTADTDGTLNFDVKPVSMHPGNVTVNDGEITIIGKLKDSEPYLSGGNAAWNQESDLEYCTKIKVIADDGTLTEGYNSVNVSGATGVTIIVTAATDYDPDQFELTTDGSVNMEKTPYKNTLGVAAAINKAESRMNGAAAMSYADLKAEHIADYKAQFDTVKFTLTDDDEICMTPTDELQSSYSKAIGTMTNADGTTSVSYDKAAYNKLDKHLEELHYNYARYMMISSSRSTTMPANLQGKWCQSTAEIWGSCYCININMEMNYWFAGGANLSDSGKSLINWFKSQIPAGRVTARNMYKVTPKSYKYENGEITFTDSVEDKDDVFIMHTKQAIMGTTDLTGSLSIQSAGNTAWLMYNLWDLYQTTGDKKLLEEDLYPIMRKAANFYTQYLYTNERKTTTDTEKYPDGYYYTSWAGRSPEQGPTHEGIKYDLQLIAGMYDYTITAAEVLGVDEDKAAVWKEIRSHLELPVELGDDGQIKEWAEETAYNTDAAGNTLGDPVHRHISHLVGLYPGTLISRDTPELLEGAKIVLQKRGDDSTG
ncbi:MAG: glycosyl hydrolase family 95 catalytic domain-containing protein, partial [Candidatus Ornithomonoglobus sp.]